MCEVVACLFCELLATPRGACSVERDLQEIDGEKSLGVTFFQTHDDARDQPFRTFPGGKTETRRREQILYWFPLYVYLVQHL